MFGHLPLWQPKLLNALLCLSNFPHCKFHLSKLQFLSTFPGSPEARVQAHELAFTIQMQLGDTDLDLGNVELLAKCGETSPVTRKEQRYLTLVKQQLQSPWPSASILPGSR